MEEYDVGDVYERKNIEAIVRAKFKDVYNNIWYAIEHREYGDRITTLDIWGGGCFYGYQKQVRKELLV